MGFFLVFDLSVGLSFKLVFLVFRRVASKRDFPDYEIVLAGNLFGKLVSLRFGRFKMLGVFLFSM